MEGTRPERLMRRPERLMRRPVRPAGLRIVMLSVAVLVLFAGLAVGGYVYINHVASGIGRMPVMFASTHVDHKR